MPTTPPFSKKFDLQFQPDHLLACQNALTTLGELFPLYLLDIGPDDRRRMAKPGPGSTDFIHRTMTVVRSKPDYKPGFLDVDEFQRDLDAMDLLTGMLDQLRKLLDLVEDSEMVARNEAYKAGLAIYDCIKSAAKLGSLDARLAADDLAQRLPQRNSGKPAAAPGAAKPAGSPDGNAS